VVLALVAFSRPQLARADEPVGIDAEQFRSDLATVASPSSRTVGSEGYYQIQRNLQSLVAALGPNVELRRHEYPVMVPVTRLAILDLGAGRAEPVYPFWPAQVRVCSTPENGITGRLVYAGNCEFDELKPKSLDGQIAVIEASAREKWRRAFQFGARAMLVLGSPDTHYDDLLDHDLSIPVNLPRFYVPPGALADQLRAGGVTQPVTVKARVDWQRKMAVNFYALVRPSRPIPQGWPAIQPPAAVMFSVPYDASSLVPDLSPGASQAVQTACGLALLRDIAKHPWDRPVIIFFSGADTIQQLGTRNMFLALAEAPAMWREELTKLTKKRDEAARDLARARELAAAPQQVSVTRDRTLLERITKLIDTDITLEQDELFRLRMVPEQDVTPAMRDRRKLLEDRQVQLNRLHYAFQQKPALLAEPEFAGAARFTIERLIKKLAGDRDAEAPGLIQQDDARAAELNQRIDLYHWLADAIGREREPDKRATNTRLIELLVGLDLSDRGQRCGPLFFGNFASFSNVTQIQEYRDWFAAAERAFTNHERGSAWWGEVQPLIDFEPLNQSRSPQTYLCAPLAIASELCPAWATPGMTFATLDDLRLRRDTPTDTLDHIDIAAILPQLNAVRELFAHATADPSFRGPAELKRFETSFTGQVVSPAPGRPVPDLPRGDFLATYYAISNKDRKIPLLQPLPGALGVRRNEIRDTDVEGNYQFEGLPRLTDKLNLFLAVNTYRVDPKSGAITATTDLGREAGELKWWVDLLQDITPVRSLVFTCEEFSLVGLYDPRFLQSLDDVIPLDARRNSEPQRYGAWLYDRMMAGFIEPGSRVYLPIRYGRVGNRLLLINMPENPDSEKNTRVAPRGLLSTHSHARSEDIPTEGLGYTADELNHLGPLSLASARDFWRLDEERLKNYRRAGVSSDLVDSLHGTAGQQIRDAEQWWDQDRGVDFTRAANGAWANEARVYDAVQDMARDVIYGAIFLLMLCVPFSFCMERLLIGTPNVYKQIAGMCGIFLLMTLVLWAFHPAFKISASPMIVVLAFAIMLMSVVVTIVVYGKFDSELKRIHAGRGRAFAAGVEGASFARGSVLMSAVLLGIANMRKRPFRTALTSITIVLITFAVLCFTSTTRYIGTTTIHTGISSSYDGILLRQRGFRGIPDEITRYVRAVLADPELDKAHGTKDVQVVERRWNVDPTEPKTMVDLVGPPPAPGQPPRVVPVQALLGLSPGESQLSRVAEIIGAGKFKRLQDGERDIIYLSSAIARRLDAREGDRLRVGGIDVQIAGIFDAEEFDEKATMLSGEPIAPLKYDANQLDVGGRKLNENNVVEAYDLSSGAGAAELASGYEHLSATQFAIVPAELSLALPNSVVRTVSFKLRDEAAVKAVSEELAKRFALAMFAGYDDGVRMVSATQLSAVSGASQVAVPLAIAGLIIFNTMMGSIAERKREIHIYTSLGLAPLHVGALFLAEASVYGLLGAVFGYIIGQGAGTALLKLGWLGNVTLNYSGTSAIMTMGLILLVVLLSAIVPARLASKLAAPSIERSWRVPLPQGDQIRATLPFTINKTAADGAIAYLAEFFDMHQEGGIGKFSAARIHTFSRGASRGLKAIVWLTPFDLGVRQELTLLVHPGRFAESFEVELLLRRLSGNDTSWYRMNRPFLTELRKQFLQWRSLTPERMMRYVQRSHEISATEPAESAEPAEPVEAAT
jgi:hypothetical protein